MSESASGSPKMLKVSLGTCPPHAEGGRETRSSVVIGRGLDCDIVVKDVKASRRHCKLSQGHGFFLLEDLASRNGTYVDGKRISEPVQLQANQTFKIGDTIFYLA